MRMPMLKQQAAPATLAIVQCPTPGTAVATSATITISPTAGNLLVVAVTGYSGNNANHGITDNIDGATGWTKVGGVQNGSGDPECVSLWYKKNIPAGITSLVCTAGVGTVITIAIAHEVSGASTSSPFTGGEAATNAVTATTNAQTGSVTNATANSIFFAVLTNNDGTNPALMDINGTGTVGTWNLYNANSFYSNGASLYPVSVPNIIVSSGAARVHGWTTNSKSTATVIAAFH